MKAVEDYGWIDDFGPTDDKLNAIYRQSVMYQENNNSDQAWSRLEQ